MCSQHDHNNGDCSEDYACCALSQRQDEKQLLYEVTTGISETRKHEQQLTETNEEPFDLDCAVRRQLAAEKAPLIDAQIGQTTKELGAPQAQTQAVR